MKTAVLKFWRSFTYCLFLIPTYKLIHLKLMWNNIIWSSVKYRRESLFRMYGISAFLLTFVIFWNNSCLILWFVLPTVSKALFFFFVFTWPPISSDMYLLPLELSSDSDLYILSSSSILTCFYTVVFCTTDVACNQFTAVIIRPK